MSNISYTPISKIKVALDNTLGKDNWFDLEVETIVMAMDLEFSDLLHDKIYVLQILCKDPSIINEDFAFTLFAVGAVNNRVVDFGTIPNLNSLELAYFIIEVNRVLSLLGIPVVYSKEFITAVSYILRQEGYSKPVAPFQFIPIIDLEDGQTEKDTSDKEKAINIHVATMDEGKDK